MRKAQREAILAKLEETYKGSKTALNYNSPFELLVAVILSAQCTDERVNVITARMFPRLNTPEKMGALTQEEMEAEIRDCGLYHAKAKNLLGMCHMLTQRFNSVIPDDIKTLMELPGVGQKTANVIASIIYKIRMFFVCRTVWGWRRARTRWLRKRSWKKLFRVKSGVTRITGLSGMGVKSARHASRCAAVVWL